MQEKIKTLNDTVDLMNSEDWRARLLAEYYQLSIRIHKLKTNLNDETKAKEIKSMIGLRQFRSLEKQLTFMEAYREQLLVRLNLNSVNYQVLYPEDEE